MGRISALISNHTKNYVHSIMIGNSIIEDEYNGFLMNINTQVPYFFSPEYSVPLKLEL